MVKVELASKIRITAKRADILAAAQFFLSKFKLQKYNCTVFLEFRYLHTFMTGNLAEVEKQGDNYKIVIDAGIYNDIALSTIAHEMIHVKQYIKGQLSEDTEGYQLWKGKHVSEGMPYHCLPWEVEAMRKEVTMSHEYIAYRDSI